MGCSGCARDVESGFVKRCPRGPVERYISHFGATVLGLLLIAPWDRGQSTRLMQIHFTVIARDIESLRKLETNRTDELRL